MNVHSLVAAVSVTFGEHVCKVYGLSECITGFLNTVRRDLEPLRQNAEVIRKRSAMEKQLSILHRFKWRKRGNFVSSPYLEQPKFFKKSVVTSLANHLLQKLSFRISVLHRDDFGSNRLVDILDRLDFHLSVKSTKQHTTYSFYIFEHIYNFSVLDKLMLLYDYLG